MSGDLERSEVVRWTQARLDRMPRERKKKQIDNYNVSAYQLFSEIILI